MNGSNPDSKGVYTVGHASWRRVPEHTFFKTMWKSLFSGIKECAGMSAEREAKLMHTAEKAKKVVKSVKKAKGFVSNLFKKKHKKKKAED